MALEQSGKLSGTTVDLSTRLKLELLGGWMLLLGAAALLALALLIVNEPNLQAALAGGANAGTLVWVFIRHLGLLLPLGLLLLAFFCLRLGWRMRQREPNAAAWARQLTLWAFFGLVGALFLRLVPTVGLLLPVGAFYFIARLGFWWQQSSVNQRQRLMQFGRWALLALVVLGLRVVLAPLNFAAPLDIALLLGLLAVVMFVRQTRRHDVDVVAWRDELAFWGFVYLDVILAQAFVESFLSSRAILLDTLSGSAVLIAAGVLMLSVYAWLTSSLTVFAGGENEFHREERNAWNLLVPTLVVLGITGIYPLEQVFISSVTDEKFATATVEPQFVGLDNYVRLLGVRLDTLPCELDESGVCQTRLNDAGQPETVYVSPLRYLDPGYREGRFREVVSFDLFGSHFLLSARDATFIKTTWDTIVFTVVSVVLELILGLILASMLVSRFRGVSWMRVAILIPWAVPTIVSTQFWNIMLRPDDTGLINNVLLNLGLIERAQSWLTDPDLQLPVMIAVDVWKTTPSMAIMLMPGLLMIPKEIYQAAAVDGANWFYRFTRLTLPLLTPIIGIALIFRTMNAIRVFDVFQLLVGRQRFSLSTYTQEVLIQGREVGYSSAIGVVIFFLIIIFITVYLRTVSIEPE